MPLTNLYFHDHCPVYITMFISFFISRLSEKFEETKGIIRNHKSKKNRQ